MKITILGPAHPYRGGLASIMEIMARTFRLRGNEVDIKTFTLQYPSLLFPGKSQTVDTPPPADLDICRCVNTVNPFNWLRVGRRIRRERPDFVLMKYWTPFMAPCFGTIARIAQDLYLSPSAVKYHTQKIYRAFDVHTRAELAAFMRQPRLADVAPARSTDALSPESRAFTPETEAFGRQCAVGDDQPASAPLAVTRANPCERLALQHGLTDRERQTLELLALGETVAAIARALDVSENTVKTYTKRVYRKLDVHSKQDIIDLCREG